MAYIYQVFGSGQVLTAPQMNQIEFNVRDHQHGVGSVTAIMGGRIAASSWTSINSWNNAQSVLEFENGGFMSRRGLQAYMTSLAYYDGAGLWRAMVGGVKPSILRVMTDGEFSVWSVNTSTILASGGSFTPERHFMLSNTGTVVGTGTPQGAGTFVNPGNYYQNNIAVTASSITTMANSTRMLPLSVQYIENDYTAVSVKFLTLSNSGHFGASGTIKTIGKSGSGADHVWNALDDLPSDTHSIRVRAALAVQATSHAVAYNGQYVIVNFATPSNSDAALPSGDKRFPFIARGHQSYSAQVALANYQYANRDLTLRVQSGNIIPIITWATRTSSMSTWSLQLALTGYNRTFYGS